MLIAQIIIVCIILLAEAFLAYQYLSHRKEGKGSFGEFWRFLYSPPLLTIVLIALAFSVMAFLLGKLWQGDSFLRSLMNCQVMMWLFVIGYIDAREQIIPNGFIVVGLVFWLVLFFVEIIFAKTFWLGLLRFSLIGAVACGGVLFIIALIVKTSLGMGDVKLFLVLGLLYGVMDTYGIILFSVLAMGIVSIVLLILKKATAKTKIPMAPFVIFGFSLSLLAGM